MSSLYVPVIFTEIEYSAQLDNSMSEKGNATLEVAVTMLDALSGARVTIF